MAPGRAPRWRNRFGPSTSGLLRTSMEILTVDDLAVQAGLVFSHDESPGIRRLGRGKGFGYVGPDGSPVDDDTREWIRLLVIPPAWKDVWISPDPDGHILATGRDAAGRKQYIYHPVQGESFDEALANLREALELYFEDEPFPEGIEPPIIAPVDIPA